MNGIARVYDRVAPATVNQIHDLGPVPAPVDPGVFAESKAGLRTLHSLAVEAFGLDLIEVRMLCMA